MLRHSNNAFSIKLLHGNKKKIANSSLFIRNKSYLFTTTLFMFSTAFHRILLSYIERFIKKSIFAGNVVRIFSLLRSLFFILNSYPFKAEYSEKSLYDELILMNNIKQKETGKVIFFLPEKILLTVQNIFNKIWFTIIILYAKQKSNMNVGLKTYLQYKRSVIYKYS